MDCTRTFPDTMSIFMSGQRSCTACANFSPSLLPGMSMSVNNKEISQVRFEQGNRFVGVASFEGHEACFLDDFDSKHPQQRIILHDENDGRRFVGRSRHYINDRKRSEAE